VRFFLELLLWRLTDGDHSWITEISAYEEYRERENATNAILSFLRFVIQSNFLNLELRTADTHNCSGKPKTDYTMLRLIMAFLLNINELAILVRILELPIISKYVNEVWEDHLHGGDNYDTYYMISASPIHLVVQYEYSDELLLAKLIHTMKKKSLDIDKYMEQNRYWSISKYTALQLAVKRNNVPCVRVLLANGASVMVEAFIPNKIPTHLRQLLPQDFCFEMKMLLLLHGVSSESFERLLLCRFMLRKFPSELRLVVIYLVTTVNGI